MSRNFSNFSFLRNNEHIERSGSLRLRQSYGG